MFELLLLYLLGDLVSDSFLPKTTGKFVWSLPFTFRCCCCCYCYCYCCLLLMSMFIVVDKTVPSWIEEIKEKMKSLQDQLEVSKIIRWDSLVSIKCKFLSNNFIPKIWVYNSWCGPHEIQLSCYLFISKHFEFFSVLLLYCKFIT